CSICSASSSRTVMGSGFGGAWGAAVVAGGFATGGDLTAGGAAPVAFLCAGFGAGGGSYGYFCALRVGSPTPKSMRSPCSTPAASTSPVATMLVVHVNVSTGRRAKAAAVVVSLALDAGVKS